MNKETRWRFKDGEHEWRLLNRDLGSAQVCIRCSLPHARWRGDPCLQDAPRPPADYSEDQARIDKEKG